MTGDRKSLFGHCLEQRAIRLESARANSRVVRWPDQSGACFDRRMDRIKVTRVEGLLKRVLRRDGIQSLCGFTCDPLR
jgi:hypothetical protein